MTDIEKKAREYARKEFFNANRSLLGNNGPLIAEAIEAGFDAGAAYALGNQWRDAEKEKPEKYETVLVVASIGKYPSFGQWCGCCWKIECSNAVVQSDDKDYTFKVYAWLPIPEYEPKGE